MSAFAREILEAYVSSLDKRSEPALLFGQRFLTPSSVIDRAVFISRILRAVGTNSGAALFIGDDDLVSPVFAELAPTLEVHVVDVDSLVLEQAASVASNFGRAIVSHHCDVKDLGPDYNRYFDIAIADPFPTYDGRFESIFWSHSVRLLKRHGILVSTFQPSHKPPAFGAGAMNVLSGLGFRLIAMSPVNGEYATFPFEFSPYETYCLDRFGAESNISHSKRLFAALLNRCSCSFPIVGLERWFIEATNHYLTLQAGVLHQAKIAADRGAVPVDVSSFRQPNAEGGSHSRYTQAVEVLRRASVTSAHRHAEQLMRARLTQDEEASRFALILRAIESWERK